MSQKPRQNPKKSKAEQVETVIRLINAGKTQAETAAAIKINIRTVQRWLAQPTVKERLVSIQQEVKEIAKSDPVVLSVTDIRAQVQEILDYRDSQRSFALQMGQVVEIGTRVLLRAVERLEANPEDLNVRSIPPLMRTLTDASEKVSNAWARTTGLDDLLESIKDDMD
jgi:hypothetical protein